MKKVKIFLCIMLAAATAFCFTSCKSDKEEETTTQSTTKTAVTQSQTQASDTSASEQTESTSQDDTSQTSATEKESKKTTSTTQSDDEEDKTSVSVNQALDILSNNYYGKKYDVNATVKEGDYQYFAVYDKNSVKYASVKVNLKTSDAVETVINSNSDPYEFNLNSYAE